MKIPYNQSMLLVFLYLTTIFFAGCVDTSVNPIPSSINYSSQMKVVNLATGAASVSITLNGQNLGNVPFGGELPDANSGFLTIPSGSKTLNATFNNGTAKSFRFSAATEYKFRAFLVGNAADTTGPSVVIVNQRYIWQTKDSENGQKLFPADTAWISVFNGSPDITINSISFDSNLNEFATPLALGQTSGYLKNAQGQVNVEIIYNDTDTLVFNHNFSSKGRYTIALYDVSANLKYAVLVDD